MLEQILCHIGNSEHNAFVINDLPHSYGEFGNLVRKFNKYLVAHPELPLIGVISHNDLETYAFITATLFSNCGYVILSLSNPMERNELIIKESGLQYVVSSNSRDCLVLPKVENYVSMSDIPDTSEGHDFIKPDPEAIAYILFTSGSTGNPKGVVISKKNLNALAESFFDIPIEICQSDNVLQMFDLTFDGSVLMLFLPLCKGATIYTTDPSKIKYLDIARILTTYSMDFVFIVPSVVSLLKPFLPSIHLPTVRTFIVGAEATTIGLLEALIPSIPNATIWNLYGPTEGTVCVVAYHLDDNVSNELYKDMIPIGKPMPGVKYLVVDEDMNFCSPGEKGELLIGGEQISSGYINDDEKNMTSFKYLPYDGNPERFYLTGDLVYVNKYGNYMYCGRKDHQVKFQGYRIELSEIEYHARSICNCQTVAMVGNVGDGPVLHLFVENYQGSDEDLIEALRKKIPQYMIPRSIVRLVCFPLSASEKIDRVKLEQMISDNRPI